MIYHNTWFMLFLSVNPGLGDFSRLSISTTDISPLVFSNSIHIYFNPFYCTTLGSSVVYKSGRWEVLFIIFITISGGFFSVIQSLHRFRSFLLFKVFFILHISHRSILIVNKSISNKMGIFKIFMYLSQSILHTFHFLYILFRFFVDLVYFNHNFMVFLFKIQLFTGGSSLLGSFLS